MADQTQTPAETPWYAEVVPQDQHEWIANKKWDGPAAVVRDYRNLESYVGADKAGRGVIIPKDDDPEAWGQVYDKLGRPGKPEEYGLPVPEGDPGEFAKQAASWFHEAGLTKRQADALAGKWNEYAGAQQGEAAKAEEARQAALAEEWTQAETALRTEWGEQYDNNLNMARAAAQKLGVDPDALEKMQGVMGQAALMRHFHSVAQLYREGELAPGGQNKSGAMTPAQARAEIKALQQDRTFYEKLKAGDVEAQKRWTQLHEVAVKTA